MPAELGVAYDALNLMGGDIDWSALPVMVEIFGITDVETMIRLMRFVVIEERKNRSRR
jgi:hypothetical protein